MQLNSAMRGASDRNNAGYWVVRLHTKGVYLRLISWLLENLAIFGTIVKSEAMVDAPGRFMYILFTALSLLLG